MARASLPDSQSFLIPRNDFSTLPWKRSSNNAPWPNEKSIVPRERGKKNHLIIHFACPCVCVWKSNQPHTAKLWRLQLLGLTGVNTSRRQPGGRKDECKYTTERRNSRRGQREGRVTSNRHPYPHEEVEEEEEEKKQRSWQIVGERFKPWTVSTQAPSFKRCAGKYVSGSAHLKHRDLTEVQSNKGVQRPMVLGSTL